MPSYSGGTQRPSTLPSNVGGGQRPSTLPSNVGGGQRPSTMPARPGAGNIAGQGRPGISTLPATRPSAGDLGNFLNLPAAGAGAAGIAGNRPSTLPANTSLRDQFGSSAQNDRTTNRQDNRGDRQDNRLDNRTDRQENRPFGNQLSDNAQTRQQQRQDWAQNTRENWDRPGHWDDFWNEFQGDFGEPGWRLEYPNMAHAYYHSNHPYAHGWWTFATAAAVTSWVVGGYGEPVYYDYGSGGTVAYEDDSVTVNDEAAGTPEEYAQSSVELAASGAQTLTETPAEKPMEWMPLGVFALSTSPDEKDPTRFIQLAISKEGVINGTFYNKTTDKESPVMGAVDKKTQRASFYAADKPDVVMETGIYNLTKDDTTALVHFGTTRTEEYLLVRVPPKEETAK